VLCAYLHGALGTWRGGSSFNFEGIPYLGSFFVVVSVCFRFARAPLFFGSVLIERVIYEKEKRVQAQAQEQAFQATGGG
jgi:hypothetical protein